MSNSSVHTSDTPDIFSSSPEYAQRFSGDVGQWFLDIQSASITKHLQAERNLKIIDVGGGHAQTLPALLKLNAKVIVTGSSSECSQLLAPYLANNTCEFLQANMLNLPVPNKSFDVAICLRQISHISDWQKLIAELCRVSSKKVIIDYPPKRSFNIFYSLLFPLKKFSEENTRTFLIFNQDEINSEFKKHGFELQGKTPQFLLPMFVYRCLKNKKIASFIERIFASLKLTTLFGSPVVAEFVARI